MFELILILNRYLYAFYIIYFLLQGVIYIFSERNIITFQQKASHKQKMIIAVMHINSFFILSYIPGTFLFDVPVLLFCCAGLLFFIFASLAVDKIYKNSCILMWNCVFFLLDFGIIELARLNFESAKKQLIFLSIGFLSMLFIPIFLKLIPKFEKLEIIYLIIGLALLILPTFIGVRKNGAVLWIQIGQFSFQPSEIAKFLFVFYLASVFRRKMDLRKLIFPTVISGIFVLILIYQKDLGGSLIYFMAFMIIAYISTGSELLFFGGLGFLGFAVTSVYKIFLNLPYLSHVKVRVMAWQNPWQDISDGGFQIAQSLFAIGHGGFFGSGFTRGFPKYVPVYESDFIFSAICEEFGVVFGVGLICVFILIFYRGVHISLRCKRRYYSLLAAGFTGMLAFQTFLILGGVIKLIPMTGVTLPFISQGGSSIIVSIMMVGIIQWVYMYYEGLGKENSYE